MKVRTGLTGPAASSRQTRPLSSVLSRITDDSRYAHSPRATPPMPVLTMSFQDMGCVSPQHSHTKAPASDMPEEPQKPIPLARAELK